ncbi:MAG: RluA family pseudouridine synthase [Planctomycetes bacterium]|nr:RluA family pseudouridine synthase [Planctomycetota bacterium]
MPPDVAVLHRDEHLLVVDKPAGVLVVPAQGRSQPCLTDVLTKQLGQRVLAVHRLDEQTTGCLAFALDESTKSALDRTFRDHEAVRDYLALTTAVPSPESGCIESHLEEGPDGIVRVVRRGGRRAVTHYATLARRGRGCLVRCRLETGRRNQIRVHLAALGCPVAGDRKYGYRARPGERYPRVMLHSWSLKLRHPVLGETIEVTCDAPEPELRP